MKILVACEFSGIVRDAFTTLGHDATSCDLDPSETPGKHLRCDVRIILGQGWDMMIAHPPCDHLARSGGARFAEKRANGMQQEALNFVQTLMNAPIPRICIENPVGVISTYIRKPDQYIEPFHFGRMESKKTGLWLKNLPLLVPTKIVPVVFTWTYQQGESSFRKKDRSRTFQCIADAMAAQWGYL